MRLPVRFLFVPTAFVLLAGCQQQNDSSTQAQIAQLTSRVSELEQQQVRAQSEKILADRSFVFMELESKGFSILETEYGLLTVAIADVTPYLDGYKLRLQIGNLTSATLTDAKITARWGPKVDGNLPVDSQRKARRTKEMQFSNDFLPGAFTPVELVLAPAKPEELRTLAISATFGGVKMRR